MDVVFLSRLQFAFAAGFHFIFPPLTLGLSFIILLLETLRLGTKTRKDVYQQLSDFLIRIFALIFTLGAATGIVLEFSFGTNWSQYSRLVGDIFGAPLAAEGVFAFFMESTFLGILLFGRKRVSAGVYWLSAFLVFFASHLSGFWIIIANSWMQTPAGFKIENGRAIMTSFYEAVFNPSTVVRYVHVVIASWITGSLLVSGIASWYLLKKRHENLFRPLLKLSMIIFIITALLQFASGHMHAIQVAETQPQKMAAFEALWHTTQGAPMSIIGIPDEKAEKTHQEIRIPKLLSLLVHLDPNSTVTGLDKFPKSERPPIAISYMSYHLMIALGSLFAVIALLGILFNITGTLYTRRWYLWLLLIASPFPLIVNDLGWIAAEVGRQPWAVYGILKTNAAASVVVPAWQILVTLILFVVVYLVLFLIFLSIFGKIMKKGPETIMENAEKGGN